MLGDWPVTVEHRVMAANLAATVLLLAVVVVFR